MAPFLKELRMEESIKEMWESKLCRYLDCSGRVFLIRKSHKES